MTNEGKNCFINYNYISLFLYVQPRFSTIFHMYQTMLFSNKVVVIFERFENIMQTITFKLKLELSMNKEEEYQVPSRVGVYNG